MVFEDTQTLTKYLLIINAFVTNANNDLHFNWMQKGEFY